MAGDKDLPQQTEIRFSPFRVAIEILLMIGLVAIGIYLSVADSSLWMALILIAAVIFFKDFRKLTSRAPQIILDDKGIKIRETNYPWHEIANERAHSENIGKKTYYYLSFETGGKTVEINFNDYDITVEELERRLAVHRGRAGRRG